MKNLKPNIKICCTSENASIIPSQLKCQFESLLTRHRLRTFRDIFQRVVSSQVSTLLYVVTFIMNTIVYSAQRTRVYKMCVYERKNNLIFTEEFIAKSYHLSILPHVFVWRITYISIGMEVRQTNDSRFIFSHL